MPQRSYSVPDWLSAIEECVTILCSREQSVGKNQDQDPAVAIVFQCECGKQFETRDEDAGRHARCPACQRELILPQP